MSMVSQGFHKLMRWAGSLFGVKAQAVNALRSKQPQQTARALGRLRAMGYLRDGSLAGVVLAGAQLEGLDLAGSVMPEVDFYKANLSNCVLSHAHLRAANFTCADLRGTNLQQADLRDAYLWGADLRGANLSQANMNGAFLDKHDYGRAVRIIAAAQDGGTGGNRNSERVPPDWDDAFPAGTLFDEQTILPDGSRWSKKSPLRAFTEPLLTDSNQETSILA